MGIGPNTLQKSFRLIIELGEKKKKNVDHWGTLVSYLYTTYFSQLSVKLLKGIYDSVFFQGHRKEEEDSFLSIGRKFNICTVFELDIYTIEKQYVYVTSLAAHIVE
jgi:hypothetical protein